jgi:hypothetical protein
MVPMWFRPLYTLSANNESILVNGMIYKIGNFEATYCFNMRFLNFKRNACSIELNIGSGELEDFFKNNVRWASCFFMLFYGFGSLLNMFSCFIGVWMIKGYMYGLGNAMIFMSAMFYFLGLL